MSSVLLPAVMEALTRFGSELANMRPLLPTYIHLILSAVFPIFTAAHASLRRPPSAASPRKNRRDGIDSDEDDNGDSTSPIEALTTSDAILFPILAGATLTGLYLVIKWLEDPSILNKILGYYFSWGGIFFTFKFLQDGFDLLRSAIFPKFISVYDRKSKSESLYVARPDSKNFVVGTPANIASTSSHLSFLASTLTTYILLPASRTTFYWTTRRALHRKLTIRTTSNTSAKPTRASLTLTATDVLAAIFALSLAVLSVSIPRIPWYLTNLTGFAFCYGSLQLMTPGTASVGSLLLTLLFFYDIYMVFYTPMMVTVATKLDVPIKLLFPRPAEFQCILPADALPDSTEMKEYLKCLAKQKTMAMLGLGDIVVPGIMIAFALRFDLYNYYRLMKAINTLATTTSEISKQEDTRNAKPVYNPARGSWSERFYTNRNLWSPALRAKSFPKPYFKATMAGYVAGMIATVLVMQIWKHAQPALLYLVPGVLVSFWGMALWRREVRVLWGYDEAGEEKEKEKELEAKEKEAQKDGDKTGNVEEKKAVEKNKGEDDKAKKISRDPSKPLFSVDVYVSDDAIRRSESKEKGDVAELTQNRDFVSTKASGPQAPQAGMQKQDKGEDSSSQTSTSAEVVSKSDADSSD